MRSQIESLGRVVTDAEVKKAGAALNQKLIDLEMNLLDLRLTGGQDGVRYGSRLISKLAKRWTSVSETQRSSKPLPVRRVRNSAS